MNPISDRYLRFAREEAAGQSALYEALALHVADSPRVLAFLARLPKDRQQPNLLFAGVRMIAGAQASISDFDDAMDRHQDAIAGLMLTRTTQTNEPGRCAALMPVLARIEGPLALIEVGASAGLCLLPDCYAYDWGNHRLAAPPRFGVMAPVFHCKASGDTPCPVRHPDIVWRAGLDLNPLDVSDDQDVRWLEALVWPEHHARLRHLRQAIAIARTQRPRLVTGDLRQDLGALIAEAPPDAHLVVFHTAVLTYVADQRDRDAFAAAMIANPRVTWLSNEGPRVFPRMTKAARAVPSGMFFLAMNGRPVAWTAPHGQEIRWI